VACTGGEATEQIKMWDMRARSVVYELSTGNNAVAGLAWDTKHYSLYVATECRYMDRMGNWRGYRRAKIPKDEVEEVDQNQIHGDEDVDMGDDDDGDDDDDDYSKCWPKMAYHDEDYFGHMFDAGEHSICEFLL
jgi:hypothetical protein